MKTKANRRVNLHMQTVVWKGFCLATSLFYISLVLQSGKHHKEPMFLHLLRSISFMHHFVYSYFFISKIHILFCMDGLSIEGSLIGLVYRKFFSRLKRIVSSFG